MIQIRLRAGVNLENNANTRSNIIPWDIATFSSVEEANNDVLGVAGSHGWCDEGNECEKKTNLLDVLQFLKVMKKTDWLVPNALLNINRKQLLFASQFYRLGIVSN